MPPHFRGLAEQGVILLRRLVERLSRGRVFVRRLPGEFASARLYVTPDAALAFLKPGAAAYDTALLNFASEFVQRDHVVWDIGANVGVFTFAAAHRTGPGGTVIAVEPDLFLASLIRRSARLKANAHLNVQVLSTALANEASVATFLIAARGRASNALESAGGRSQAGGVREKQLVPTLTVDLLLQYLPAPHAMKIDVEGAEMMVFSGATRLLTDVRPVIYVEVGDEYHQSLAQLLHQHNYVLFDGDVPPETRKPIQTCTFNTLACPAERSPK
jgi:FkbM family methyltransferase